MSDEKYGPNTAEVEAYLALLPKLTDEQREDAREAAWDVSWDTEWHAARVDVWDAVLDAERDAEGVAAVSDVALDAVWAASWAASWAALAIIVRDLITPEQFDILTDPMRAAGIDFDALTTKTAEQ